jgi:hypothetical protein
MFNEKRIEKWENGIPRAVNSKFQGNRFAFPARSLSLSLSLSSIFSESDFSPSVCFYIPLPPCIYRKIDYIYIYIYICVTKFIENIQFTQRE